MAVETRARAGKKLTMAAAVARQKHARLGFLPTSSLTAVSDLTETGALVVATSGVESVRCRTG
jgi:hypothetical protein